jgi:hypothetical protein
MMNALVVEVMKRIGHENAGWVEKLGPSATGGKARRRNDRRWSVGLWALHDGVLKNLLIP